jgi:hypothetical protein
MVGNYPIKVLARAHYWLGITQSYFTSSYYHSSRHFGFSNTDELHLEECPFDKIDCCVVDGNHPIIDTRAASCFSTSSNISYSIPFRGVGAWLGITQLKYLRGLIIGWELPNHISHPPIITILDISDSRIQTNYI